MAHLPYVNDRYRVHTVITQLYGHFVSPPFNQALSIRTLRDYIPRIIENGHLVQERLLSVLQWRVSCVCFGDMLLRMKVQAILLPAHNYIHKVRAFHERLYGQE